MAGAPILVTDGSVESSRPSFSAEALYELGEDDSPLPDVTAPVFKAATSGGSTGRPKLIMSGLPGVAIATGGGVYRIGPDDTCVTTGPLYHNAPFVCSSNALTQGAHVVLMPRFDAEETLRLVDKHKATWLYVVPTMMSRIWKLPEAVKANYDVSSLRTVWHMAAPCPPWLKEAWIHWIGPDAIMELYAGTEAQSATIITGREWLEHRGSVGQVRAGEMATFNEAGERLPLGEIGEIYLRRPEGVTAILPVPRRDRPDPAGRLGEPGRHRLLRRRRLSLPGRPAHRHGPGRRRQRLSGRDRGGAGRAPRRAVLRRGRPAGRGHGQHPARHRAGEGQPPHGGGAARAPARAAGPLQAAAHLRVRRRQHPRRRWQGPPHGPAGRADRADEGGVRAEGVTP
ncbi:MAG: AMP-binding protein [Caulobacteraceae bacterium]